MNASVREERAPFAPGGPLVAKVGGAASPHPAFLFSGGDDGFLTGLPRAIQDFGFVLAAAPPAALLVTLDAAIASADEFADVVAPEQEALVVMIVRAHAPDDWQAARVAATLCAFVRHRALAWAPRRIRVNAIGFDARPAAPASLDDVAATILAMWRFPSMTGQLISLGAP